MGWGSACELARVRLGARGLGAPGLQGMGRCACTCASVCVCVYIYVYAMRSPQHVNVPCRLPPSPPGVAARWLRDRFYEAGADDTLVLGLPGGGGGGVWEVETGAAAMWTALFLGCAAGVGVFAGRAWREASLAGRLQAVQAAQREALEQQLK